MFETKKMLKAELKAAQDARDLYFHDSVKKSGHINKLRDEIFKMQNEIDELKQELAEAEADCILLMEENAELKSKYTAEVEKSFRLTARLSGKVYCEEQ